MWTEDGIEVEIEMRPTAIRLAEQRGLSLRKPSAPNAPETSDAELERLIRRQNLKRGRLREFDLGSNFPEDEPRDN